MWKVKAFDTFNNTHEWKVESEDKAREYAKRIITEGLWFLDGNKQVFYPVHRVVKVVIEPARFDGAKEAKEPQ